MTTRDPRHVRALARRARGSGARALAAWLVAFAFIAAGVVGAGIAWDETLSPSAPALLVLLGLGLYWCVSQEARHLTRQWSRDRVNLDHALAAVERQAARERARGRERLVALASHPARPPARAARACASCLDGSCPLCQTVALETAGMDVALSRMLGRPV